MTSEPRFTTLPSSLDREAFIARFGGLYEHSPWVAERLWDRGLDRRHDSVQGLQAALAMVVDAADRATKLALIRAHPDLAGRLALAGELTADSRAEQASAGLDACTADELGRFQTLNEAYRARFGFPFVMAVKDRGRAEILAAFEARLKHDPERERAAALAEIHKIAALRLRELLGA